MIGNQHKIARAIQQLHQVGTQASLFIDPELAQIDKALRSGQMPLNFTRAPMLTIGLQHDQVKISHEITRIKTAVTHAHEAKAKFTGQCGARSYP